MLQIDGYYECMSSINTNLAGLDLNLLTALHALLEHRSVSKAAETVGRTQSAMSHSLSRLRHQFQDPLLVRDGWSMKLTPTAQAMAPQVAQVAAAVGALFDGNKPFDPQESSRTIRIATRDICVPMLTPLIAAISEAGSGLTVEIIESTKIRGAVASNEADVGFGFGGVKQSATLDVHPVRGLTWCVFAPKGHPYVAKPDVPTWAASAHVLVGSPGLQTGPVEAKTEALGLKRHVFCYAPNFMAAIGLAANCNALFTSLLQPFQVVAPSAGLVACPMPFQADFAMPEAPAILTLRKPWGDPFETWLSAICQQFIAAQA